MVIFSEIFSSQTSRFTPCELRRCHCGPHFSRQWSEANKPIRPRQFYCGQRCFNGFLPISCWVQWNFVDKNQLADCALIIQFLPHLSSQNPPLSPGKVDEFAVASDIFHLHFGLVNLFRCQMHSQISNIQQFQKSPKKRQGHKIHQQFQQLPYQTSDSINFSPKNSINYSTSQGINFFASDKPRIFHGDLIEPFPSCCIKKISKNTKVHPAVPALYPLYHPWGLVSNGNKSQQNPIFGSTSFCWWVVVFNFFLSTCYITTGVFFFQV